VEFCIIYNIENRNRIILRVVNSKEYIKNSLFGRISIEIIEVSLDGSDELTDFT
jgi:hypothetical protein